MHFSPSQGRFKASQGEVFQGLALIISARSPTDLSKVSVAQGFVLSRGRRNARAEALITWLCHKGDVIDKLLSNGTIIK